MIQHLKRKNILLNPNFMALQTFSNLIFLYFSDSVRRRLATEEASRRRPEVSVRTREGKPGEKSVDRFSPYC